MFKKQAQTRVVILNPRGYGNRPESISQNGSLPKNSAKTFGDSSPGRSHGMNVISPTPHFVVFAQDVLYRGADFPIVWTEILATFIIGSVYFGVSLYRFRRVIFSG